MRKNALSETLFSSDSDVLWHGQVMYLKVFRSMMVLHFYDSPVTTRYHSSFIFIFTILSLFTSFQ